MKIATWNVNSLSVRLPQVLDWLIANPVEVLCLQELKLTDDKFPLDALASAGYAHCAVFGQKTYNGVAILSLLPLSGVARNIEAFPDEQSRVIAATVETPGGPLRVVNGYFVNGQEPGSEKFAYKMRWLDALHTQVLPTWARNHPPHQRGTRALPRPAGVGPDRCLPHVRSARKELFVVGLPHAGFPEEPRPAHRPHPGQPRTEGRGEGLHHRPRAAQEQAAQRPRAGGAGNLASGL
jgi:hypothetical protein